MGNGWLHTNLSWIDWAIIAISVVALRSVSLSTRRYMKGVADFLAANRTAGRYLLTIASQMGSAGTITFIAWSQMYEKAGFTAAWWQIILIPAGVIITLTGFMYYRYRESRALTMAQLFEIRYNKRFRVVTGIVNWICGIVNFGIFPAVTAHFFIYFCGLPPYWHPIPGLALHINMFATVMAADLGFAFLFVSQGGQISVMITDCVQGMFSAAAFIVICFVILAKLRWPEIITALNTAPKNASMFHPYHTSDMKDYNVWFFAIWLFSSFYTYMSWLGTQGFYAAARTPHEQKMGNIISNWRLIPQYVIGMLLPVAAFSVLHLHSYAPMAAKIHSTLAGIPNPQTRDQALMPVAMAQFLPPGIRGLLATTMLFYSFTGYDSYMHSWGSIFIQDVWMPLKKKALSPEKHIRALRWSIAFVAVFGFMFSLLYPQSEDIFMFFAYTGIISSAAMGVVIIGALYWKKGTTPAAYAALISGAMIGTASVAVYPIYRHLLHQEFPINGQWMSFIAMLAASLIYVVVSLITSKRIPEFNLEKMLHRGKYAVEEDQVYRFEKKPGKIELIFGITDEFSLSDKILAIGLVAWNAFWVVIFVIVTAWHYFYHPVSTEWFTRFWKFYIWQFMITAIPATIWFQIGGIMDIRDLFRMLATMARNHSDDGRVLDEPENVSPVLPSTCADTIPQED
jgi:SSS family solute:Na+ symporter